MNIEDIARLAGVSRSTISRVLNNRSDVNERTRTRVMQIIEENNYHPSHAARTLAAGHTRIIGILVPHTVTSFASPYLPTLLQGISDTTHRRDYAALLWWGQYGEEEERFTTRILHANFLIEGLIIAFHAIDNLLIQRVIDMNIPFVMVERPNGFGSRISYVTVDNVQGASDAVEHLISLGRRRIAHITGALSNIDGIERLAGYRSALEKHGIPFAPELVVEGMFDISSGYRGMKALLNCGVDAVFAGNDDTAVGALHALREAHIKVPDDIALVGFDDLPPVIDLKPELTTVHQPVRQKGAAATTLLLDMIEGKVKKPQQHVLSTHLVIRESCGAQLVRKDT